MKSSFKRTFSLLIALVGIALGQSKDSPAGSHSCTTYRDIPSLAQIVCSSKVSCACFVKWKHPAPGGTVRLLPKNSIARDVSSLHISSSWSGFGPGMRSEYTISSRNGKFFRGKEQVSEDQIAVLLDAIAEPKQNKPGFSDLGIDGAWLSANADEALNDALTTTVTVIDSQGKPVDKTLDSEQKTRFKTLFTDVDVMSEVAHNLFRDGWTIDDDPDVHVSIQLRDRSVIEFQSTSTGYLMLPWKFQGQNEKKFFDSRISFALAKLLPEPAANQGRLSGANWEYFLGRKREPSDGFLSLFLRQKLALALADWIKSNGLQCESDFDCIQSFPLNRD